MKNILIEARKIAFELHNGVKYGQGTMFNQIENTVEILKEYNADDRELVLGYLHKAYEMSKIDKNISSEKAVDIYQRVEKVLFETSLKDDIRLLSSEPKKGKEGFEYIKTKEDGKEAIIEWGLKLPKNLKFVLMAEKLANLKNDTKTPNPEWGPNKIIDYAVSRCSFIDQINDNISPGMGYEASHYMIKIVFDQQDRYHKEGCIALKKMRQILKSKTRA